MNSKITANQTDHAAADSSPDADERIGERVALGDRGATGPADLPIGKAARPSAKDPAVALRLRSKLFRHGSSETPDGALGADGVTADELAKAAAACLEEQPWWRRLAEHSGDAIAMRHGMGNLKIPAALCFNLTLARDERPILYRHSLRVALLCHYLAIRLELRPAMTDMLLMAAVSHDLGELYIDPALLAPEHRITGEERRFVLSHPITGYLMLQDIDDLAPQVARTVLHHHERLDGSGYPSGLNAEGIEPLSRILMVADVAESIMARFADRRRLSTMLRLNSKKYDSRAAALLHEALIATKAPAEAVAPIDETAQAQLAALAAVLAGWERLRRALDVPSDDNGREGAGFLFAHIRDINSMLLQCGFNPDNIQGLAELAAEDPDIAGELVAVLDELRFQLKDLSHEIDGRGRALVDTLPLSARTAFVEWQQTLQVAVANA